MLKAIRTLTVTSALLSSSLLLPSHSFAQQLQNQSQVIQIENQLSEDTLVAEVTKPSVVRVLVGCAAQVNFNGKTYTAEIDGHGSGFFVNPNGYIVTNAHVVDLIEKPEECKEYLAMDALGKILEDVPNQKEFDKKYRTKEDFIKALKFDKLEPKKEVILTNGDKLPFEVVVSGNQDDSGRDVAIIKVNIKNAPSLLLADSEQVQLKQDITAVGYPGVGDIPEENGVGYNQPSFTDGKVSAQKYINGALVLQVSAPITHGNSGGPVINNKGEVVGISTFAFGNQSGFGFLVASNTIKDYLKQAGIRNEEGVVTQRYRQALKLYNNGQCKEATQEFTAIHNLFPQHPSLDKYIQKCG